MTDNCHCGATKLNSVSMGRYIMGTFHTRDGCGLVDGLSYGDVEELEESKEENGPARESGEK